MSSYSGLVRESGALMWRRRSMVSWLLLVTLVFGWISSRTVTRQIGRVLDRSLASQDLVHGFDLARMYELTQSPEVNFSDSAPTAVSLSFVFLVFMVFITGGVLQVYREDRKLRAREFFEASGHHFWRFLRLMLLSLIPFAGVAFLGGIIRGIAGALTGSSSDRANIIAAAVAAFLTILLVLIVRLWFDVAQVRAVAQDERRMIRNLFRSAAITRNQVLPLVWIYFRISLLAWVTLAAGTIVWMKLIPPERWFLSFLWLELIVFAQLATRFWQRAAAVKWYERFAEDRPELALDLTTSQPQEIST